MRAAESFSALARPLSATAVESLVRPSLSAALRAYLSETADAPPAELKIAMLLTPRAADAAADANGGDESADSTYGVDVAVYVEPS